MKVQKVNKAVQIIKLGINKYLDKKWTKFDLNCEQKFKQSSKSEGDLKNAASEKFSKERLRDDFVKKLRSIR